MLLYKYIYGPVNSWRLGRSLGIDPISSAVKVCTFDCVYCQIGQAEPYCLKRKVFVRAEEIMEELKSLPEVEIDYITFSGTGEPTLAKNLASIIKEIKSLRKEKIAVLTNSTLLDRKDVQKALINADLVEAKLDASSEGMLEAINRPDKRLNLKKIIEGIKEFRKKYKGKFTLQIMFTKDNIARAERLARIAKSINPDEVHINTPLRPSGAKPISEAEMKEVKRYFKGLKVLSVYDAKSSKKTKPISRKETLRRRGKY
ncbi:radical SAM protein [bacterium]|nr:MAG: radical SAM protein [bacterium]